MKKVLKTFYKIKVTKADIKKGKKGSVCDCPIALAIKRATGLKGRDVAVGDYQPEVDGYIFEGPCESLTTFIEAFDGGEKVKPFSFNMEMQRY